MIAAFALVLASFADPLPRIGARCEGCHASATRAYRETGMARALGPIERGELDGLREVPDATSGFSYRFSAEDEFAAIVEAWKDPRGESAAPTSPGSESSGAGVGARGSEPGSRGADAGSRDAGAVSGGVDPGSLGSAAVSRAALRDATPLAFAIGAGILDRSYVARRGDLMFFAPLEVVRDASDGTRAAVLSPGHAMQSGTRFTIPIAEECLRCHTTSLPPRDYPLNVAPPASWQPSGIDCSGCHAHADEHARWREVEARGEVPEGRDPGLVTTFGDAIESVSVCARCHLQGDANLAIAEPRRGIPPPGGDLLDRRAIFVAAQPTDEIGFVSHVERLALSKCFVESLDDAKPLTCVTCHTPHQTVFAEPERARARAACAQCHPDAAAIGGASAGLERAAASHAARACSLARDERGTQDCVACHMRETRVFDVDHVEIHDHWIQTRPPPPSKSGPLRVKEAKDGRLALFEWPGRAPRAHAGDPGLEFMAAMALGRSDLARDHAAKPPGATAARTPMYFHLLGSLRERERKLDDALRAYERALQLDPELDETRVNLGGVLTGLRRPKEAIELLTKLVERRPSAEGALRNRALAKLALGDRAGFAADLEASLAIHPQAAIARALAQHYRQSGDTQRAEAFERRTLELDPRGVR